MSKSVLVIDTPKKGCMSCPIGQDHSNMLGTLVKWRNDVYGKV